MCRMKQTRRSQQKKKKKKKMMRYQVRQQEPDKIHCSGSAVVFIIIFSAEAISALDLPGSHPGCETKPDTKPQGSNR
ncbi:unnamed protein product [Sphagnum jensenii]|uniref:Uncharacterized protein n=2 Tax=Sphagnum jensenii TaxID=128206 RepID=A0ABP1AZY4_9BRYO